jgi:hypothetical protein
MNKVIILAFTVFLLVLGGCRTPREASELPRKYKNTGYVLDRLAEERVDFEWLSSRIKLSYQDDEQKLNSTGTIRIRKDSAIWISITPVLGIEAMRALITPDSIYIIDRIKKTYDIVPVDNLKYLSGMENLSFRLLQDVLLGNSVFDLSRDADVEIKDRQLVLNNGNQFENIEMHVLPQNFRPAQVNYKRSTHNQALTIQYSKHENISGKQIPQQINFDVSAPQKLSLSLEFSRYSLNEPQELPFSIPANYEKRQ